MNHEKTLGYLFEQGELAYDILEEAHEVQKKRRIKSAKDINAMQRVTYCGTAPNQIFWKELIKNGPPEPVIKELPHYFLPLIASLLKKADMGNEAVSAYNEAVFAYLVEERIPVAKGSIKEAVIVFSNNIALEISEFGKETFHSLRSTAEIEPPLPLNRALKYGVFPSGITILASDGADMDELEEILGDGYAEINYLPVLKGKSMDEPFDLTVEHMPRSKMSAFGSIYASVRYENGKKAPEVKTKYVISRFKEIESMVDKMYTPAFIKRVNDVSII